MDLVLPLHVSRLLASVLCPDNKGLKEQLIRGLWLTQAGEREAYGMQGEPAAAEASITLQQPEVCCVSPRVVVPGSRDPGSGRLHSLPGGEESIVTCVCTQDSWWLQQQPLCFMPVSSVHADSHVLCHITEACLCCGLNPLFLRTLKQ